MATIVNTPAPAAESSSGGMGFLVGVVLLIVFVLGLLYFGIPAIGRVANNAGTQINVPDKIDVNVQQQPQQ